MSARAIFFRRSESWHWKRATDIASWVGVVFILAAIGFAIFFWFAMADAMRNLDCEAGSEYSREVADCVLIDGASS